MLLEVYCNVAELPIDPSFRVYWSSSTAVRVSFHLIKSYEGEGPLRGASSIIGCTRYVGKGPLKRNGRDMTSLFGIVKDDTV